MQEPEFTIHVTDQTLLAPRDERITRVLGWKEFDLFRQPVEFLFPPDAHGRMQKLFTSKRKLDSIIFPKVPLRYHAGGYINFDMSIDYLDAGEWRLNFYKSGLTSHTERPPNALSAKDALPAQDMVNFFDFVQDVLESPFDGDMDMAMVEVSGLKEDSTLDEAKKADLRQEVESELKKQAMGGRIGKVDTATYSLLTSGGFEEEDFEAEMISAAKAMGLSAEDVGIRSQSVTIDDRTMPAEQVKQALGQVAKAFTGEVEPVEGATTLSAVVTGIQHHRNLINKALGSYAFRAGKRLVSFAATGERFTLLYEGKVSIDSTLRRPDSLINMIDHADLALKHDVAQLDEILRLKAHNKKEKDVLVFYDLCRASLLSPSFHVDILDKAKKAGLSPETIGFRVLGMPPIKRGGAYWEKLFKLKEAGFRLWVDRFGDAVIDDKLADLVSGGVIEMPQALLKKLSDHYDGKELIQRLVKVWTGQSVWVVSQDYSEEKWKRRSIEAGIEVYLSDHPMTE